MVTKRQRSKIKYTDEPVGRLEIIPDFLPPPAELVHQDESSINLAKGLVAIDNSSIQPSQGFPAHPKQKE
jgi:hypothetical protein